MQTSELPNQLLGHSINNPILKSFIEKFLLILDGERDYENIDKGIYFEFDNKKNFEIEYGKPKSIYSDDELESILTKITFENNYFKKKKPFDFQLPYNLKIGDSVDEINVKIGTKPFEKNKGISYEKVEYNYYYNIEDKKILIKLDENMKFVWMRFWLINLSEKYIAELKKSLTIQNKNLKNDNILILRNLKTKTPVKNWEIRMNDGDDMFTEKNIEFAKKTLETFIDNLCEATAQKKAPKIYAAVKKIVLAFNRNNYFIETLEREELINFIQETVKLTGFEIENNSDLTLQWREW